MDLYVQCEYSFSGSYNLEYFASGNRLCQTNIIGKYQTNSIGMRGLILIIEQTDDEQVRKET